MSCDTARVRGTRGPWRWVVAVALAGTLLGAGTGCATPRDAPPSPAAVASEAVTPSATTPSATPDPALVAAVTDTTARRGDAQAQLGSTAQGFDV